MSFFKKLGNQIFDWSTNNSLDFTREDNVYKRVIEEIEAIDNLLDIALTTDFALDYPFKFNSKEIDIYSLREYVTFYKNKMLYVSNDLEYQKMKLELIKLEREYQKLYRQTPDLFLKLKELYDVQEHVLHLTGEIYQNATLEAFKDIEKGKSLLTKEWTLDELENIRQNIAIRRSIIIPYLGEIERKK